MSRMFPVSTDTESPTHPSGGDAVTVTNLREERDRRNRQRLVVNAQRERHSRDVKREHRQIANGATAQGCSTMVTVCLLAGGLALLAVARKVAG